jgi:hypothetical protein
MATPLGGDANGGSSTTCSTLILRYAVTRVSRSSASRTSERRTYGRCLCCHPEEFEAPRVVVSQKVSRGAE